MLCSMSPPEEDTCLSLSHDLQTKASRQRASLLNLESIPTKSAFLAHCVAPELGEKQLTKDFALRLHEVRSEPYGHKQ